VNSPQPYRFQAAMRRMGSVTELWLKVAVIAGVVYLTCEILPAFLRGGAVDRVLGGGH
jgi:hypothetical protein